MAFNISFKCPYCGYERKGIVERTSGQSVDKCPAVGGCDKQYVLEWGIVVKANTYKIDKYDNVISPSREPEPASQANPEPVIETVTETAQEPIVESKPENLEEW